MKMIFEDRRRFLTALILSSAFHGVILVTLGFWSLKIPPPPELPPLLTVTITPETRVIRETAVAEKQIPEKQRPAEQPEKDGPEKAPVPASPQRINRKTIESKSDYISGVPASREGNDSQFWKDLQAAQTNTIPAPSGDTSTIEYDDPSPADNSTKPLKNAEMSTENSVLSRQELDKLASRLDSSTSDSEQSTIAEEAITNERIEPESVFIPDNATLLLDRGNSDRKPIVPLDLNIPRELLSRMDRDGSVTVEFTLSPEGRIIQPFVKRSSVEAEIDTEILEAIRKWSFTSDPGATGDITGEITILFKVNKE